MRKVLIAALFSFLAIDASCWASIYVLTQNKNFPPDTLFGDDIILAGNNLRFESQVQGDLLAACQQFVFTGRCEGSFDVAAREVNVYGQVEGSVRAFAQTVDVNSAIGRNLIAFAASVNIGPDAEIGRDVTSFCRVFESEGKTTGKLTVRAERVVIGGYVGSDLDIICQVLTIKPNTVIDGNLRYRSPTQHKIPPEATIKGQTQWIKIQPPQEKRRYHAFRPLLAALYVYLILNFIFSLLVFIITLLLSNASLIPLVFLALIAGGLVIIAINKKAAINSSTAMRRHLLLALGLGLVMLLLFPVAVILAIVTVIGIPIALGILFAFGTWLLVGAIYALLTAGAFICKIAGIQKQEPSFVCLIVGVLVIGALSLIPVLGWVVVLLVLMLGIGGTTLAFFGKTQTAQER